MALIRLQRRNEYMNILRRHHVEIDGVKRGMIRKQETVAFEVSPGSHTISASIDWWLKRNEKDNGWGERHHQFADNRLQAVCMDCSFGYFDGIVRNPINSTFAQYLDEQSVVGNFSSMLFCAFVLFHFRTPQIFKDHRAS